MRTSKKNFFFQNLFNIYKVRVKYQPEMLVGFVEKDKFYNFFRKTFQF